MTSDLTFAGYRSFAAGADDPLRLKWNTIAKDVPADCPVPLPQRAPVSAFNAWVNKEIRFDRAESESLEAWQTPEQTFSSKRGDCKDYALLKYAALKKAGIEARIVLGEIKSVMKTNPQHAWVAAFIDGVWCALDNTFDQPVRVEDYANWIPSAVLNDSSVVRFGREFSIGAMLPLASTNTGAAPMPAWRGIIGKSFTPDAFEKYMATLKFNLWRPRFIVVHNTSAPDLKTWNGWQARKPPVSDEKWAQNLVGYYRDQQHWSAGPHLFVTPKGILAFSPLTGPGTHSPAWNSISWGVETVGEFEHEPFSGPVRDNLVAALAILHAAAGLQPEPYERGVRGLHFHKEDPVTTHKSCPGKNMIKAELVADVEAEIQRRHSGGGHPDTLLAEPGEGQPEADEEMPAAPDAAQDAAINVQPESAKYDLAIEILQRKLIGFNYHEIGNADGLWGGKTRGAITAFMNDRGKSPDGLTSDSGFTSPAANTVVSNEINDAIAENWSRPIAASRANATAKDIAPKVEAVRQSLWQRFWAKIGAGFAAIGLTGSSLSSAFDSVRDKFETVHVYLAKVPPEVWFVTIGIVAALVWYSASKVAQSSVKDFNTGRLN